MLSNKKVLLILIIVLIYVFLSGIQRPDIITESDYIVKENLLFRYEVNKYQSSVEVVSFEQGQNISLGMDTTPSNLNFGFIPKDSLSRRFFNITNLGKSEAKVVFEVTGNIESFVKFNTDEFFMKGGEKINVMVYFNSTDVEPGNYSGNIYVIMEKSKYDIF